MARKTVNTPPRYCLQCDDGSVLKHGTKDRTTTINGETITVRKLVGWHCPACGEIEFDHDTDSAARYSKALDASLHRQREAEAARLRAQRKKLKLTQAEAGKLFGGGVSAFSEYENGKTQPHRSTVLLLRLLGNHPELLEEIRQGA